MTTAFTAWKRAVPVSWRHRLSAGSRNEADVNEYLAVMTSLMPMSCRRAPIVASAAAGLPALS